MNHATTARPLLLARQVNRVVGGVLAAIGALLLAVMTVLVIYQVVTRYVLGSPADFTEELVKYLLIWTGFIGGAYAFTTRRHMALTLVRDRLPAPLRTAAIVLVDVLVLVFALFVMAVGGAWLASSAMPDLSALLGISRGLVYAVAPVCGALIVLIQLANLVEDVLDPSDPGGGADAGEPVESREV
ncbi:TRAP transporter small permease [Mobilicoccus massiliensis]|uniref:TRAP transporter small permease n=1 Tax=Mobilicoccus massiliensis TaxID=1522310 RepID=UPI000693CA31|nr:TRAP transporter small permease [Mobilicoccus massiliensis]